MLALPTPVTAPQCNAGAAYARDGAVLLRGAVSPSELDLLTAGISQVLARPSPRHGIASARNDAGLFFEDFCRWRDVAPLEAFVRGTHLSRIAAELLGVPAVRLFHDHILVKEPGTAATTPFHQDEPYYDIEGPGVSFWLPVDPVAEEECLEVMPGTHLGPLFLPRTFLTKEAKWHAVGALPEVPDYGARPTAGALRWALAPGDAIAFSFRAVHGAPGVRAIASRRRVFSLRFVASEAVFVPRPWRTSPQLADALTPGEEDARIPGQPLRGPWFPTLFSAPLDCAAYPLAAGWGCGAGGLRSAELDALVARSRKAYLEDGAVVLDGFLAHEALAAMAAEARACEGAAFVSTAGHNVYQDGGDGALPPEHARNTRVRTVVGSIAYDQLPRGSLLRQLYQWEPLREFVRRVVGASELHPLADAIGACTVNVFRTGMEQG